MDWFMSCIKKGQFPLKNPYNGKISYLCSDPEKIHTLVFWSKNYRHFLEGKYGETLRNQGYNLFFNFTINTQSDTLEPGVPKLQDRVEQLEEMCDRFNPGSIHWRFDPICYYLEKRSLTHNLKDFSEIADHAEKSGISRCITSFTDIYRKVSLRGDTSGISFVDPELPRKINLLTRMEKYLYAKAIRLYTCCEKEVMKALPESSTIQPSSCVPGDIIKELYGGKISLAKDPGQRIKKGCRCSKSVDIGSYENHLCHHHCLYCYA